MLFDGWWDLGRVLIVGAFAYFGVVATLRISGKRTLSKMNAFDLVVTVALGSTLATVLLNKDVSLAEGLLALVLLCSCQYAVAFASTRSRRFRRVIKSEPTLLLRDGEFLVDAMERERVGPDEILAAVRSEGISDLNSVGAVVLETDGTFSVLTNAGSAARPTLSDVSQ